MSTSHNDISQETWKKLNKLVDKILSLAKKYGATSAEAGAYISTGLSTTVRLGEAETIKFSKDKLIAITVYIGQQKGSVTTSDISDGAIKRAVSAACRIAKYTEKDSYSGLADPTYLAKQIPNLDLYHPSDLTIEQAIKHAKICEDVALDFDKRIVNSEGSTFKTNLRYQVYGNTLGFLAGFPSSYYSLSCTVIGKSGNSMQRDSDYTITRDINELATSQTIGEKAARRTLARLDARKIKTCKSPVLFVPNMAKGIWSAFISTISGKNLYRKTSFLLNHLNKPVFSNFVYIREEPHLPKAIGSVPFDNEGVVTKSRYIVKGGQLHEYVLNSYSARKLAMETTGNAGGIHNLVIEAGSQSFNDLLSTMGKGLVVTELMGHGTNIVTGDYSCGAFGFWVDNGQIQYPVEEITIAGNLKDMFLNLLAIGNDVDRRGNILTGSVILEEMTIAGN